jgi:hypothetical protein
MKNKALKICLSGLALSVAGLVDAASVTEFKVEGKPIPVDNASPKHFKSTGIQVLEGERIIIEVNGSDTIFFSTQNQNKSESQATPNGVTIFPERVVRKGNSDYLVPSALRYSLVGLISDEVDNDGEPVESPIVSPTTNLSKGTLLAEISTITGQGFIGSNYSQIAHASGYLYLAFNDDYYYDNFDYWSVNITTLGNSTPLASCAAISGGYISITADSSLNGCLAAIEAVTIGANTPVDNIYAGAAVTTGDSSTAKNIFSGAATSVGANAVTKNVHAGAAITLGANSEVGNIYAGAAITTGAGALTNGVLAADANTTSTALEDIHNATSMGAAMSQISVARAALTALTPDNVLLTTMGTRYLDPGVWEGGALNITASSTITFDADETSDGEDHVWVINLGTLTVGATTHFEIKGLGVNDTASIIWNVDTVITLGASTSFRGTAFVGGDFSAATSTVSCGNLYAGGYITIGTIGVESDGSTLATCENQNSDAVFSYLETLY